jgi:ribonucleoside-diphosphate reductase alpha chain
LGGLLDCIGILTSVALQYGVPLGTLVNKLSHVRFEPSGPTKSPQIPIAKSIIDYIFRWMEMAFAEAGDQDEHTSPTESVDT